MRHTLTMCLFAAAAAGLMFAQAPPAGGPTQVKKASGNQFGPKSKGEAEAVNDVIQAQAKTPDDMIKAVDNLTAKYADTVYKSFALELEAEAYQQKGDNAKAIVYAEQSLMADPKNFEADNLLANVTAATTRDTDLDKEEKLTKADKYAHDALDVIENGGKPQLYSNATDEQWDKRKKQAESLSYQAMGTVALTRKKNDEAIADFEKGIAQNPDPVLMIRAGRALLAAKKFDEAIAYDEKVMNSPDAPAQIKSIAQADRVRAVQAKGPAAK
ncbi:MAG TPA: tetratricopeptide repeat protein [Bryobacteraceae bacterium]|nr:tetratricopeptide repeat protein [Bryobacteraceae bacterium]